MFKRKALALCAGVLALTCGALTAAAQPGAAPSVSAGPAAAPVTMSLDAATIALPLKKGDRLAIVGDSITEQRIYSRFMEDYLTACTPELDLWIVQLGWSGEEAVGLLNRMDMDLLSFKPTIFTTCYGMNDGGYRAYNETIGETYLRNMSEIAGKGKAAGARVVVGSPGAVDTQYFKGSRNTGVTPDIYNDNLDHLKTIARSLAVGQLRWSSDGTNNLVGFANVHDAMIAAMGPAKAKLGMEYPVCGRDGFHPGPNGHLVMAYAFLKALGQKGDIGTINVDVSGGGGKVEATTGHKVLSFANGAAEIESTRYPFCFIDDEKSGMSSRSILPFVPFNQDLNRFTLVVTGLKADSAKVTWGTATKPFTRDQLAKGVNLADEFAEGNPFTDAFRAVDAAVAIKQGFETSMVKNYYHALAGIQTSMSEDADAAAAIKTLKARLVAKQDSLRQTVKAAVGSVKHTIKIEPQ